MAKAKVVAAKTRVNVPSAVLNVYSASLAGMGPRIPVITDTRTGKTYSMEGFVEGLLDSTIKTDKPLSK